MRPQRVMTAFHRSLRAAFVLCVLTAATSSSAQLVEPSPAVDLAARLIAADDHERQAILADRDRVTVDLGRGLNRQANRLMDERRLPEALTGYELMRRVYEAIGDRKGMAAAMLGIGTIYGRQGDYAEAARNLREGLAIAEEIADDPNAEVALNNLGIVSRLQGEYEEALEYYGRALSLAEKIERPASLARTLNNIGTIHMLRGNYREALRFFDRSLQMKEAAIAGADRATALAVDVSSSFDNIGTIYEQMGDDDVALDYFERAVRAYEQLGSLPPTAEPLSQIGRIYMKTGRSALAVQYLQRALTLFEARGSKSEAAETLQDFGHIHRTRGELTEAMDDYNRSLAIREAINDRPGTADVLTDIASMLLVTHDAPAALETATRAVRLSADTGDRETFWHARLVQGRAYDAASQPARAEEAYRDAVETIEELRRDAAGGDADRQRFLEDRLEPFQRLALLLAAGGRAADALAVAERAKARVMLDVVRGGRAETRLTTTEERERERQLERAVTQAHARVQAEMSREAPDERRIAALRAAFSDARLAAADFRNSIYSAHPDLRLSLGDADPGSLDDAAAILRDAHAALLEYMVTPDATTLFVVTRDEAGAPRLHAFTIAVAEADLAKAAEHFRQQLASRDLDVRQTGRALYRQLLGPADADLRGKTSVIVVPDGPLWSVPFQALQPGATRYLIEDAAVSVVPSIAVAREMRSASPPLSSGPPTLVAFGDASIRGLREMYGARNSQLFTGSAATEARFEASAGHGTVLHITTHGVLDDATPMYSYLTFAGRTDGGAGGDGRLEAWEIMNLDLHPFVTVLAACETARGHIGAGEGVIGLSWAFFLAGSPRTVVSLWQVDAAATDDLMLAFHRSLRHGFAGPERHPAVAESLRSAALSLLRDPRYRHPFYWAGFVAIGDGS